MGWWRREECVSCCWKAGSEGEICGFVVVVVGDLDSGGGKHAVGDRCGDGEGARACVHLVTLGKVHRLEERASPGSPAREGSSKSSCLPLGRGRYFRVY